MCTDKKAAPSIGWKAAANPLLSKSIPAQVVHRYTQDHRPAMVDNDPAQESHWCHGGHHWWFQRARE
jgi:hypothetical protein